MNKVFAARKRLDQIKFVIHVDIASANLAHNAHTP
jgi:hypothetical protein